MELENQPEEGSTPEQEQVSQPTVVEQEAIDSGWVPKDQYNGEEHKWVDAAEFLRRGELFKKIEDQSRQLKDVKRALVEFKKLHEGVREVEYKRALETLRAQKKAALEDGDADAVIAADERIDLVKEEQRRLQAESPDIDDAPSGEAAPEFTEWKAKNSWYTNNAPMKAFADTLGTQLARSGLSPVQVLKRVEDEVRKEFPNRFRNPNQDKPNGVEGSKPRGSSGSFSLTPEETRIMKTIVRTGVMTEAEYIKDLKTAKGV
jgi:hypothetical protein